MVMILAACGLTAEAPPTPGDLIWPAPTNPLERTVSAGLQPEVRETLIFHVHAHLDVFVDGRPVLVPAAIGINIADPGVRTSKWNGSPAYGGIAGCAQPCISPLHTHDVSGVIHTESSTHKDNTLGQLFTEWGVPLDANCFATYCKPAKSVAVYVDGTKFTGDPGTIPLSDRKEIAIVVGTPPAQIPNTAF